MKSLIHYQVFAAECHFASLTSNLGFSPPIFPSLGFIRSPIKIVPRFHKP